MVDVLARGSMIFLDEYHFIRNGYIYIKDGVVEKVGSQPVPEDYEYATLIIGGPNRVIIPALGMAYTDIGLYDIHPYNRGFLDQRFRLLEERASEVKSYVNRGLFDLSIHGVGIVGVELPSYGLSLDLEREAGIRINAIMRKCPGTERNCLETKHLLEGEPAENTIYLDSSERIVFYKDLNAPAMVNRLSYNPCIAGPEGLLSNSKIAYNARRMRWSIAEGQPAFIAIYNFNEPPSYLADTRTADIIDLLSACKTVETLIVGEEIVVDAGEHLTIGKKNMGQ
ncbi:MAG: hypothetical protein LRS45_03830 [Desulfurococcales archaeon]|nr:hypothetical protein [Desulfurococcales archaeon]